MPFHRAQRRPRRPCSARIDAAQRVVPRGKPGCSAGEPRAAARFWVAVSALWIAGVLFIESWDGKMGHEFLEVVTKALLPPLIPPLILAALVRVLAERFRP